MDDLVAWAGELAAEHLASVLPRRWAHVQGVASRTRVVVPLLSPRDAELLMSAALLHDIGYAPDLVITGFHPLDGARFLRGISGSDRLPLTGSVPAAGAGGRRCRYRIEQLVASDARGAGQPRDTGQDLFEQV